jgi:hypothetical protein
MHNQIEHKATIQNKRQGALVKCTGACFDPKLGYGGLQLVLASSAPQVPALRDLTYMSIYEPRAKWCNA